MVAPEVAVSSVENTYLQDTLGQSGRAIHYDSLIWLKPVAQW